MRSDAVQNGRGSACVDANEGGAGAERGGDSTDRFDRRVEQQPSAEAGHAAQGTLSKRQGNGGSADEQHLRGLASGRFLTRSGEHRRAGIEGDHAPRAIRLRQPRNLLADAAAQIQQRPRDRPKMPFDKGPLLPIPKMRPETRERRAQDVSAQPRNGRGLRNPPRHAGKRNRPWR